MNWTSEKPTKEGWYWWRERSEDKAQVVQVYKTGNLVLMVDITAMPIQVRNIGGEWLGPITPEQAERYEEEE